MAMDYGVLTLEDESKIFLYGTPGQERLKFMWPIVAKGAMGVVILISNNHAHPLAALDEYLNSFADFIDQGRAVIGISHCDINADMSIGDYYTHLQQRAISMPVFSVDMRKKQDVLLLLNGLLSICEIHKQTEVLS